MTTPRGPLTQLGSLGTEPWDGTGYLVPISSAEAQRLADASPEGKHPDVFTDGLRFWERVHNLATAQYSHKKEKTNVRHTELQDKEGP